MGALDSSLSPRGRARPNLGGPPRCVDRHLVAELQKALDEAANKARRQQQDAAAELGKVQKQLSAAQVGRSAQGRTCASRQCLTRVTPASDALWPLVQATLAEERKASEAARALAKAEHERELEARDAELRSLEAERQVRDAAEAQSQSCVRACLTPARLLGPLSRAHARGSASASATCSRRRACCWCRSWARSPCMLDVFCRQVCCK